MARPERDPDAKRFEVPADQALLYVYRDETFGAAIKLTVLVDGQHVGDTAPHTFLLVPVTAGRHQVVSKSEKDSTIEFTAQNGNAYFVWQEIKMGVFAARSELHLMSPPEGRNAVATCSLAEPPPGLRYPLAALDPKPAGGPDTIKYEADRVCIRWTRVTFPDSGCYQLVQGARALRLAWPRQRARNPSICPRVARS